MDPFSERDIIESLKSIALSLRNIDRKMDDMIVAVRESNAEIFGDAEIEDSEEDTVEGLNDPTIKFEVAQEDSIEDGKFVDEDIEDSNEPDESGEKEEI